MNTIKNSSYFAVYGTLKRYGSNNELLSGSEFVGKGQTEPFFDMINFGGFPGVINGSKRISVEVFSINPDKIIGLDRLEGHPDFFKRELLPITLESGTSIISWMYTVRHHKKYNELYTDRLWDIEDSLGLSWSRHA